MQQSCFSGCVHVRRPVVTKIYRERDKITCRVYTSIKQVQNAYSDQLLTSIMLIDFLLVWQKMLLIMHVMNSVHFTLHHITKFIVYGDTERPCITASAGGKEEVRVLTSETS